MNHGSKILAGLPFLMRRAMLACACGAGMAVIVVAMPTPSIGQVEPICNGVGEPSQLPDCRVNGNCSEAEANDCGTSIFGRQWKYCCFEPDLTHCVQVTGRWQCCPSGWKLYCKLDKVSQNCSGDRCG